MYRIAFNDDLLNCIFSFPLMIKFVNINCVTLRFIATNESGARQVHQDNISSSSTTHVLLDILGMPRPNRFYITYHLPGK